MREVERKQVRLGRLEGQVDVHIDQAGNQPGSTCIHDVSLRRRNEISGLADITDPAVLYDNDSIRAYLTLASIDHCAAAESQRSSVGHYNLAANAVALAPASTTQFI